MKFNNQLTLNQLTPKKLSFILLGVGVVIASIIAYPMSLIFAGNWKINQTLTLPFPDIITLGSLNIPIGEVTLRYYALCILLGMLAGYMLALYLSKWHYIAGTVIDRLFIGLVIFGLVGARAMYVIFNLDNYTADPINALLVFKGGLAIYGMIISCSIYIWVYTSKFKFNTFEILDILAPSVLLGQIIGRFGNFFNYEAYGMPTKVFWKMFVPQTANIYPDISEQFFHPTFLYEIIPNCILLFIILYNYEKLTRKRAGLVFAFYAMGYGYIRFFTEFFRLDALVYQLPTPIEISTITINTIYPSQVLSLLFLLLGFLVYNSRKKKIYLKRTMAEISV